MFLCLWLVFVCCDIQLSNILCLPYLSITKSLSYRHRIIKYPAYKTHSLLSLLMETIMLLRALEYCWQWTPLVEEAPWQSSANSSAESQKTDLEVRNYFRYMDHLL